MRKSYFLRYSNKINDFVCDAFEWWWDLVKAENPEVEKIAILPIMDRKIVVTALSTFQGW